MDARQRAEVRRNRARHSRKTRGSFGGTERQTVIELPPRFSDKKWFKVSDKHLNEIDIVEFEITVEWYPELKARGGGRMKDLGLGPGALDYKLEIPVHYGVGQANAAHVCPFDAFGKPCPRCEEKFALLEQNNNKWDRDTMGHLNSSWRDFYNIYNYNDPDAGFHPWEVAFKSFEEIMQDELDKMADELFPWALDSGNTVEFKGREKNIGGNRTYIEPQIPDFAPRDPYPETTLDEVIPFDQCVRLSTYEEIAADHFGMEQVSAPSAQGVGDPPTRTRTRNTARTHPEPDSQTRTRSRPRPEPQPETTRTRSRTRTEPEPANDPPFDTGDNPCPSGFHFGYDCNKHAECSSCPDESFDACVALQDDLLAQGSTPEPEPPPEPEPEQPQTRSRRRTTDSQPTTQTRSRRRRA